MSYAGIYQVVRAKMRKTPEQLPDTDPTMVEDTGILVTLLLPRIRGAGIPASYDALSAKQKPLFDGAAGRLVAARIRPVIQAAENDGKGTVVEKEIGDVRTKYSGSTRRAPGQVGDVPLEDQWVAEAQEILNELIKENRPKRSGTTSFFAGIAGRRRADEARSGYAPIEISDLLRPHGWQYGRADLE